MRSSLGLDISAESAGYDDLRRHEDRAPLVLANSFAHAASSADWKAQEAHQQGSCGSLGPGTGLEGGKGWVVSMLPGKHEFRMRGGGSVYLTTARQTVVDFDVGRPYYIVIEGAAPGAVLEWKMLGRDWQPVAKTFLYPPTR